MVPLALIALSLLAAPAMPDCPEERRVARSPQAWRADLKRAAPGDYDAVLAQMQLRPLDGFRETHLGRVDLYRARLVGPGEEDWVVQAVFSARLEQPEEGFSDEATLYRIQVLRPQGRAWCAVGELSADLRAESPNAGPVDGMHDVAGPLTFRFTPLTSAGHEAIEVTVEGQRFSRTSSTEATHTFWEVRGPELQALLTLQSLDLDCGQWCS